MMRLFRFLPVVERELRLASRGVAAYRWRTGVAKVGLLAMALLTLSLTSDRTPSEVLGQAMFGCLVGVSALYAVLAGVMVTADALSREKREGTLGLLFLTDLRGFDVVLGKLAASSLNTVYGLIGLMPLLAIPVMLGGVPIATGVIATLAVLNLLFVSLAVGLLVSTVSWDERRAVFAAIQAGLLLTVGPYAAAWMIEMPIQPAYRIATLSPLSPVVWSLLPLVGGAAGAPPGIFPALSLPLVLLPSHLLGWGLLILAGRLAGGVWQSRRGTPVRRTVDELIFNPRNPSERAGLRRRLLDLHPMVWLLERHAGKRFYADGLAISILIIWAVGYASYGTDMFGGPTWFLIIPIAVVIHLVFAAWVVAESSMRWIEDRRSGALELLLCTALTDRDFVAGYQLMLRRLFRRPVIVLAIAEVFFAFYGFNEGLDRNSNHGRWMMLALATAIVFDTRALAWIALRLASSLATVNRVGAAALAITPLAPLGLTAATITVWNLSRGIGQSISFVSGLGIWIFWVIVVDSLFGFGYCRRWVLRELRPSAAKLQPKAEVSSQ